MATIPRFLLPRRGPMWRRWQPQRQPQLQLQFQLQPLRQPCRSLTTRPTTASASAASPCLLVARRLPSPVAHSVRHASSTRPPAPPPPTPSASNILEKPAKFNPPSHGARLPRKGAGAPASAHYGGDLSAAERAAQRTRQYPGMMAPAGTWAHWFWTSRALHLGVTVSTLVLLAVYTFFENIRRTSPYADLLPSSADARAHPLRAVGTFVEVVRMTEHHRVMEITEKRQQRVDDVSKRTMYRKAHGMDETVGFGSNGGWFSSTNKGPAPPARNEDDDAAVDDTSPIRGAAPLAEEASPDKRKKFLGIF